MFAWLCYCFYVLSDVCACLNDSLNACLVARVFVSLCLCLYILKLLFVRSCVCMCLSVLLFACLHAYLVL